MTSGESRGWQGVCAREAVGTDQIGRFDIMVDTDGNCIDSYAWQLVPVDDTHCPRDEALEQLLRQYRQDVDRRFMKVLTRFTRPYTHPARNQETELGKLVADALQEMLGVDLVLMASGGVLGGCFWQTPLNRQLSKPRQDGNWK